MLWHLQKTMKTLS